MDNSLTSRENWSFHYWAVFSSLKKIKLCDCHVELENDTMHANWLNLDFYSADWQQSITIRKSINDTWLPLPLLGAIS